MDASHCFVARRSTAASPARVMLDFQSGWSMYSDVCLDSLDCQTKRIFESREKLRATPGDGGVCHYETDIDGDGVLDGIDNCPRVSNADQANFESDMLGDVCDDDDDNDGIADELDTCQQGEIGWISSASTDHDSDGCRDADEDFDDDNDTVYDHLDTYPKGPLGWFHD